MEHPRIRSYASATVLLLLLHVCPGVSSLRSGPPFGVDTDSSRQIAIFGGVQYNRELAKELHVRSYGVGSAEESPRLLWRSTKEQICRHATAHGLVAIVECGMSRVESKEEADWIVRSNDGSGDFTYEYLKYPSRLIVLDLEGEVVDRIERVRAIAWHPQVPVLAFIVGGGAENRGIQRPEVFVKDFRSGTVAQVPFAGQEIGWNSLEDALYISDYEKVYRWSRADQSLVVSGRRGVEFSPSGRFYLRLAGEGGTTASVYSSEGDVEIMAGSEWLNLRRATVFGWFRDVDALVLSAQLGERAEWRSGSLRVGSQSAELVKAKGLLVGFQSDRTALVSDRQRGLTTVDLTGSEVERLTVVYDRVPAER